MKDASGRYIVKEDSSRQWLKSTSSKPASTQALSLLSLAKGKKKRWNSTAKALRGHGPDQVEAEQLLYELLDAGLVNIHQRRNIRGDFEPYEWRLSHRGRQALEKLLGYSEVAELIDRYLASRHCDTKHPVLESIRRWFASTEKKNERAAKLAMAVGQELRLGRIPTERTVSLSAFGNTKIARVVNYPKDLEDALGFPPEQIVRRPGQAVLIYGPVEFAVFGRNIDGEWSRPWLALTEETIGNMSITSFEAKCLLTIENLTAFEEEVCAGLPAQTVAVYTGGFPGNLEKRVVDMLVRGGIEEILHWSDMDLGGLRIFKHLKESVSIPVHAFRMEPSLLDVLPTSPLSIEERKGLESWTKNKDAPLRSLAHSMLERNCKAEQEGWFLANSIARLGK